MISKLILFIYTFYIIFLPEFTFISPLLNSGVISLVLALLNITLLNRKLVSFIKTTKIYIIFLIYLLLTGYIIILNLYNNFDPANFTSGFTFILYIINALSFVIWFYKIYPGKKITDYIINVGLVQSLLVFSMVLVPGLDSIANLFYAQTTNPTARQQSIMSFRIYGIASSYTFIFPLILGMISLISLDKFDATKKPKYLISSAVIIFSSIFNGRTAFIVYAIIFVIYFLKWVLKANLSGFLYLLPFGVLFVALLGFLEDVFSSTANWISGAISDVTSFLFEQEATGTIETLITSHLFFPENLSTFLFGAGSRTFGQIGMVNYRRHSDIGYINDIFKGGIFYTIILYSTHILYFFKYIENKFFFSMILIYLALSNFKGEIMTNSGIILIVYILIFEKFYRKIVKE